MQKVCCSYCSSENDLTSLSCSHITCRACITRLFNQRHGLFCQLCCKSVSELSLVPPARSPVLCLFEKLGPGRCTHGASCPRSHDPALLSSFWPPGVRGPPVAMPIVQVLPGEPRMAARVFVLDAYFEEDENKKTEFKASTSQRFEVQFIVQMLSKYICAFLNTQGGVLYYGITDDHIVRGMKLSAQDRDKLRLSIDQCCNSFIPEVDTDIVKVKFEKVVYPDGLECKDVYVVVIRVLKGDPGQIYFTPDHKAWVRREASIRELKSASLVAFIKKKLLNPASDSDSDDERPVPVPARRYPVWEYSDRGVWVEYPEELQSQLEGEFTARSGGVTLAFRGERSYVDFQWMREAMGHAFFELRRIDVRSMGRGKWWTQLDQSLHYFDDRTNHLLDTACLQEKPDAEVSIDSFVYYVSFERMRLSADMPIWRSGE